MGKRRNKKINMDLNTIGVQMRRSQSLSYISRQEKENLLNILRKISNDICSLEILFIAELPPIKPEQHMKIMHFIEINKERVKNVLWSLTGLPLKNEMKDEEFKKMLR
jgi:NAD-dependent oxidoreductase involved in siderophore biosynthesis